MPSGFKSLDEIINKEPAFRGLRKIIHEADVVDDFSSLFPELQKIAKAVKADKKTLTLRVENATWRNELKFKEKLIIEKINKHYSEERIMRVKFLSK